MNASKPEISAAELEALVIDVARQEGRPLTVREIAAAIPKALRPPSRTLSKTAIALVNSERLYRIGRRYSAEPDRTLHASVVRMTNDEALTASEIAKRLRASVSRVREVIRDLLATAELHAFPKQRRVVRYAAHPPTTVDLLRPELDRLFDSAKKLGIAESEAKKALRQLLGGSASSNANDIVATIRELEPDGALVYLPHLRTALAGAYADKHSFDRAVLTLLARGTVELQSHPTPSLLGNAEREAMIEDGRGGYYSAIGLR